MIRKFLTLLILSAVFISAASAQQAVTPPTIITFSSDVAAITVEDAEAGQTPATLSWHAAGLGEDYDLFLQTFRLNRWDLLPTEEPLPSTGSYPLLIEHPLNFGPPMYRLIITDHNSTILDERVLTIPYQAVPDAPAINTFTSDVQQIEPGALAQGTALVIVSWEVSNRPATANLVFEQVLDDGPAVSVELPRPNLWVSSRGAGPVKPVMPRTGNSVRLRLSLVDMVDGGVYAEAELDIPVVGTLPPATSIPAPTATTSTSQAQIVSFTVSPDTVDRGGTVTVSWEVRNASSVSVWRLTPGGPVADFVDNQPLTGTWTVILPAYHVDNAAFQLWAADASGATISASAAVQVRCPYTYFFGQPPAGTGCPLAAPRDTQASFQTFERGYMVWEGDRRQIYVLYNGGSLGRYQDTWIVGEVFDVGEPPAGLVRPERGFGKVWATQTGVRDNLGWATGQEQPYTMRIQTTGAYRYPYTYLTLPDGRVVYLVENSWGFLGQ